MNVGIYVCVILAALSNGSLSLPSQSMVRPPPPQRVDSEALGKDSLYVLSPPHTRRVRSAPVPPSDQFTHYSQLHGDGDAPSSLNQLLARLLPRKGSSSQSRSSLSSRAVAPNHRIKDRDYLGWMDFGRRSAEEYEYSP
ncbi:cholecystokinin [Nematolebias whitei]|uniref:cholecystokinin n=1 Tax=Nematolebias whitei TaxID=451745 RepID=UPI00189C0599|nr:cholecystokinin [Nematolebias whitei]